MCTILQAQVYYREFFRGVRGRAVKSYIKPFYIPHTHKELQFAAYTLIGKQCLATPVQFPTHEGGKPRGIPLHNWRLDDYIFLYDDKESFGAIPDEFRGFRQLSAFVPKTNTTGLERITNPAQLINHLTHTKETEMPIIEQVKPTIKAKTRLAPRLVFTYTNGATYTVRGLEKAQVVDMNVHYVASTIDVDGNATVTEVKRRITNEFETVVIELPNGGKRVLLDLRADRTKKIEKPPRKHKSREEYEAEQAQKEAEKARIAKVEELLNEVEKLMK